MGCWRALCKLDCRGVLRWTSLEPSSNAGYYMQSFKPQELYQWKPYQGVGPNTPSPYRRPSERIAFRENIAGRPKELADGLNTQTKDDVLKLLGNESHLDLSGQELTLAGVKTLSQVMLEAQISKLTLRDAKVPEIEVVLDVFLSEKHAHPNRTMRELDFNGLREVNVQQGMEQGNKPCAPLRDDHYATIAKILTENRSIQVLDLSNQAGEQHNFGILPIFQALVRNNSLQELRLNHSGLPFHCGIHIRSMLENNGTLRRLDLANNQLLLQGMCRWDYRKSCSENFTLEELDISNTHLDYTALPGIAESLDNQQQVRKALDPYSRRWN